MARNNVPKDSNLLAMDGIMLVLNNKWHSALTLFKNYKDKSIVMSAGYVYVVMMEVFMKNCQSKLHLSLQLSTETINKCKSLNKNFDKSIKNSQLIYNYLLNEVICSQCTICHSLISLVSGSEIIKSSWNIKQAWNYHKKTYKELLSYAEHATQNNNIYHNEIDDNKNSQEHNHIIQFSPVLSKDIQTMQNVFKSSSFHNSSFCEQENKKENGFMKMFTFSKNFMICNINCSELIFDKDAFNQLIGLVSFGYSLFLLAFQLLPQSPLLSTVVHALGFHDDSDKECCFDGVEEKFIITSMSNVFVSPISCCLHLHFACISRKNFSINSNTFASRTDFDKIELILSTFKTFDSGDSIFCCYFTGKHQVIKGDLTKAASNFKEGINRAGIDEQMKWMCQYELCRISIMSFQWIAAANYLDKINNDLVNLCPYYAYMTAITFGAMGNSDKCNQLMKKIKKEINRKKDFTEFFKKRIQNWNFGNVAKSSQVKDCKMFCYEIIYLWNCLHVCEEEQLNEILKVCHENINVGVNEALSCFLIGNVISTKAKNKKQKIDWLNNNINEISKTDIEIEKWFKRVIDINDNSNQVDEHIVAFSHYEIAQLKFQQKDVTASKEHFLRIKNFDNKHLFFISSFNSEILRMFNSVKIEKTPPATQKFVSSSSFEDNKNNSVESNNVKNSDISFLKFIEGKFLSICKQDSHNCNKDECQDEKESQKQEGLVRYKYSSKNKICMIQ